MSDTELLREAARHIRYLAGPPTEWGMDSDDWVTFEVYEDQPKGFRRLIGRSRRPVRALHVAAWNPRVAHLVADLLESEAAHHDDDPSFGRGTVPLCDTWPHAVAIARALSAKES